MTCTSAGMCKARITAALEYLQHEADPIRAITLAETQLKAARDELAAEPSPHRRSGDATSITFDRAERVARNPWPPTPKGTV